MEGAHKIWLRLLGERPGKEDEKRPLYDARYVFLDRLREINPEIFTGTPGAALTRKELEKLLDPFMKKAGSLHADLRAFVSRGLRQGRDRLGWQVVMPSVLVGIPREKARFTPESFLSLQKLRRIEQAMLAARCGGVPATPQLRVGQMLLSAMLFGGLVHRGWLESWLAALRERVCVGGRMLWLDMELVCQYEREASDGSDGTKKRSAQKRIVRRRRWFADPVTKVLISRWLISFPSDTEAFDSFPNAWDILSAYLKTLDGVAHDLPNNLSELLYAARTRLGLHVSGFLASFAEGAVTAVSAPPSCWTRLCLAKAVPVNHNAEPEDDEPFNVVRESPSGAGVEGETLADQKKILISLRRAVSDRNRKGATACERDIRSIVELQGERLYPVVGSLASWSRHLLTGKGSRKPSTVARYLGAVADKLLVVCGPEDIVEWSSDEFREGYEQVIELVRKEGEKGFARDTLGRFHRFLVHKYRVPSVGDGFFGGGSAPAEVSVDANLVTQREFDLVKNVLGFREVVFWLLQDEEGRTPEPAQVLDSGRSAPSRCAVACLLLAILGFRCGLRRNEARYLRLIDLHDEGRAEMIVRTTRLRGLKSASATRRIPLDTLLLPDELRLLRHWKARRLREEKRVERQTLLFCASGLPTTPIPEGKVITTIREALIMVTGDATLRYHHLRHSFVNWLLVRVTGKSHGLRQQAPFLDHAEFDDQRVSELRAALLGNEPLGRKGAYLVSSLCGHAELGTTFESYIHLCDWLLSRELSRVEALPALSPDAAAKLTGISRPLAYRYAHKDSAGAVLFDWERAFSGANVRLGAYRDPRVSQATDPSSRLLMDYDNLQEIPLWLIAAKVLAMAQIEGRTVEEICTQLDLPRERVERWLENAERVGQMKTRLITIRKAERVGSMNIFQTRPMKAPILEKVRYSRHMLIYEPGSDGKKAGKIKVKTRSDVFPSPPAKKHDRRLVRDILTAFEKLGDPQRRDVFDLVDYFIEKFSLQTGMLCFWEVDKARRYVDAMCLLVGRQMITLVDCRRNPKGDEATRERRCFWEKELKVNNDQWRTSYKNWGRASGYGTIGIQVCEVPGAMRTAYAFRYALYMIAIAYWN